MAANKECEVMELGPHRQFGDMALLQKLRAVMYEWEKLPAHPHQTAVIQRLSEAAHGMQQLQMTGDHFWPVHSAASRPTESGSTEWVDWVGGKCPVDGGTEVEIRLRCRELNKGPARSFDWSHGTGGFAYEGDDDIVAYRIVKDSTH